MITREEFEKNEHINLKPYACFSDDANRDGLDKHPYRTEFQRDRDRVLHSKAFRRLEYKTQVFLTEKGDHLRTRLTHSLEVAQLSKTVAIQLGLNQDLVEAIALGHDLGHTPFGHAGEKELRKLLACDNFHSFKHNVQSVKIVELLETKYSYEGLRLTLPTKEGILKHTSLPDEIPDYCQDLFPDKPFSVTLEGQVVAITDEIAQITHDLDDYLRYNILELARLMDHELFDHVIRFHKEMYNKNLQNEIDEIKDYSLKKDTIIRYLVNFLVTMLIRHSDQRINSEFGIKAYQLDKVYVSYIKDLDKVVSDFKLYLEKIVFKDYRVQEMDYKGINIINKLYNRYKAMPSDMPKETHKKFLKAKTDDLLVIADYISGMTDRYALEAYNSVFGLPVTTHNSVFQKSEII